MIESLRHLLSERRPPLLPYNARWGWAFAGLVVGCFAIEAAVREGLVWRPAVLGIGALMAVCFTFRRTAPLAAYLLAFAASSGVEGLAAVLDVSWVDPYASIFFLVLVYSLFRWGAGIEAAAGFVLTVGTVALQGLVFDNYAPDETLGGLVVLTLPAAIGASVRYRATAHRREVEQERLKERAQLARELHDTVAHYVSAIVIQAQAGQVVAATDPEAARTVLRSIEDAGAQSLRELRAIVGALRESDDATRSPQPGVRDFEALAKTVRSRLHVVIRTSGPTETLRPSLDAALFRIAQESVTNAVRHARNATKVEIDVDVATDGVSMVVRDDGQPRPLGRLHSSGFGLIGMQERVDLLGGTLTVGPVDDGGWSVRVFLPFQRGVS